MKLEGSYGEDWGEIGWDEKEGGFDQNTLNVEKVKVHRLTEAGSEKMQTPSPLPKSPVPGSQSTTLSVSWHLGWLKFPSRSVVSTGYDPHRDTDDTFITISLLYTSVAVFQCALWIQRGQFPVSIISFLSVSKTDINCPGSSYPYTDYFIKQKSTQEL